MYVEIGNDHAIEGYREDDSDEVLYRLVDGQRVTRLVFPEGMTTQEAFSSTVAALGHHIHPEHKPAWIESSSPALLGLLVEHYELRTNKRPAAWGKVVDPDAPAKKNPPKKKAPSTRRKKTTS